MAYSKQTWVNGQSGNTPVNATRLNAIENGLEAAATAADTGVTNAATAQRYADNNRRLLTTGEDSISRLFCFSSSGCTMSSQSMRIVYFTALKTENITQLTTYTLGTAAGATPTKCRLGVYSVDGSTGDLTLLYSTTNDTAMWAGTNTAYTKSLDGTWAKVAGTRYAIGVHIVTAAATPVLAGLSGNAAAIFSAAPAISYRKDSLADLPSSATHASLITAQYVPYVVMS